MQPTLQSDHSCNDFVTCHYEYVKTESITGRENNFEKAKRGEEYGQGVEYDYRSVMHYTAFAFSQNNQPTIVPKVLC
jgi:hypothetical protein